jgi:hypothetical protein
VSKFAFVKTETICMLFEHCYCFLDLIKSGDFLPALVTGDFTNSIMIHELNYFQSSLLFVSSGTRYLCRRYRHIIPERWFLSTKVNGVTTREHRNCIIVDIYFNFWREVVRLKWGLTL